MARRSDERDAARAEYMARKKKGGEVNLRQLADDLHLKYDTVRRWKSKDGWDTPTDRKPGGQPGNQNAAGNSGGGAPAGNLNAEKDGAYSRIFFDKLTPAEQGAFDDAPRNGVEALQHEIGTRWNTKTQYRCSGPEWKRTTRRPGNRTFCVLHRENVPGSGAEFHCWLPHCPR